MSTTGKPTSSWFLPKAMYKGVIVFTTTWELSTTRNCVHLKFKFFLSKNFRSDLIVLFNRDDSLWWKLWQIETKRRQGLRLSKWQEWDEFIASTSRQFTNSWRWAWAQRTVRWSKNENRSRPLARRKNGVSEKFTSRNASLTQSTAIRLQQLSNIKNRIFSVFQEAMLLTDDQCSC